MYSRWKKDAMITALAGLTVSALILYLSFTKFYGFAYLLAILATASQLVAVRAFSTYLSRVVLAGLMLGAAIMIAGLIAWIASIQLHPLLVVVLYLVLFLLLTRVFRSKKTLQDSTKADRLIDKSDLISVVSSLIAPTILLCSFGISAPSMLQIANEGWDNGSHILMLQDTSIYKGYLYGDSKTLGDKLIYFNDSAYPQAWHLATSNILNGFGVENVFNPAKPIRTTYMYVFTLLAWLMLASYVVMKVSLFVATKYTNRKLLSFWEYLTFAVVALFFQMIVLWGSFNSGFSNFIGMFAYLSILVASLFDIKTNPKAAIIGIIAGTAAVLCWFLPLPAVAIICILALAISLNIKTVRGLFLNRKNLFILLGLLIPAAVITIGQILIFVKFSHISGADQLNEGVAISANSAVNGVFPVSQVLFALSVCFTLWYWTRHTKQATTIALAIIPFVAFVIGIYVFQEITSGYTSYYLSKSMGIALMIIGIFAAPAFTFWVFDTAAKYRIKKKMTIFGISTFALGLIILLSNQSLYGAAHLLERNTRVNRATEVAVVDFLRNANQKKQDVIIMRADPKKQTEDRNGRFEMRVVHEKLGCAYTIRNAGATLDEWITRLNSCAKRLAKKGKGITVITSQRTTKAVRSLNAWNITVVEVPDQKKL